MGLKYLDRIGMGDCHRREMALLRRLRQGLASIAGIRVYGPVLDEGDLPVLSCSVRGIAAEDVGAILDADYGIAVRTGLHCAPLVHADLGTSPAGLVRFSLGHNNTDEDIARALGAMGEIAAAS